MKEVLIVVLGFVGAVYLGWFLTPYAADREPQCIILDQEFLDPGGTIILPEGDYYAPQFYGPEALIRWKDL